MPPFNEGLFRANFPEFADTVAYPTSVIEFWAGLAQAMVSPRVWCTQWNVGVSLYVAHEITLASQNAKIAKFGGAPGTFGGVANTKTVGGATVGYDSQTTSEKDAGYWNLTSYGKKFFSLVRIFGTRPVQL